jgi:hypothetical protein
MDFIRRPINPVYAGQEVALRFTRGMKERLADFDFQVIGPDGAVLPINGDPAGAVNVHLEPGEHFDAMVLIPEPGEYEVQFSPTGKTNWEVLDAFDVQPAEAGVLKVALQTGSTPASDGADLWDFIDKMAKKLTYPEFDKFLLLNSSSFGIESPYGSRTYDNLHRLSTDFVTETALGNIYTVVTPGGPSRRGGAVSPATPPVPIWGTGPGTAAGVQWSYVTGYPKSTYGAGFPPSSSGAYPLGLVPFVELIYVYWLEEGMLFQSLNRILARFQNRRSPGGGDALSRLAVSPLLPLRALLWGLAEDEKDRLSLRRRAAEYEYQYGLQLIGRAVPPSELLVERRTQFLEAFHSLLNASYQYYKEDSDKTVEADAFPLLSHLRELHLVLAYGANNQFADVSLTARIETLDVQWMLAQQEMQEFLGGRVMVPYDELWMNRVDSMKSIQGWSDASVTHFYDLAYHGEQLLLTVRHGQWQSANTDEDDAKNWAKKWKTSVQRYIHAYRAVTGVDLSERVDTTMPSTLLQRRLAQQLVRY